MRGLAPLAAVCALTLAGCGGTPSRQATPPPPHLPRALAQTWAQQADGVASALAAGDGCTAQQLAGALRTEVVQALNQRLVPQAFQEQLLATVNDLPARIACVPEQTKHDQKHKDKHGGGD